jgi:GrpB-like predicted nucleotidyltransferase (UPF0157 family)
MEINLNIRVIEVVDYDPNWKNIFETEKVALAQAIGSNAVKIDHIGSTSVIGLAAKPIIDILIEVSNLEELDAASRKINALGYKIKGKMVSQVGATFKKVAINVATMCMHSKVVIYTYIGIEHLKST